MKLAEYLKLANLTDADFAQRIGVERSTVTRLRGDQIPTREVMRAIAEATNGAVTANDFYGIAA